MFEKTSLFLGECWSLVHPAPESLERPALSTLEREDQRGGILFVRRPLGRAPRGDDWRRLWNVYAALAPEKNSHETYGDRHHVGQRRQFAAADGRVPQAAAPW